MSKYEKALDAMTDYIEVYSDSIETMPEYYTDHDPIHRRDLKEHALPFYLTTHMEEIWYERWLDNTLESTQVVLNRHDLFCDSGFIYFENHRSSNSLSKIMVVSWSIIEDRLFVCWSTGRNFMNRMFIPFDENLAYYMGEILGKRQVKTNDDYRGKTLGIMFVTLIQMLQETRTYRVSAMPTYRAMRRRHPLIKQSGDINIIYLRRAVAHDPELQRAIGESKDTQRHFVRRHWHRYWCGTNQDRHLEWRLVDTYIRGNIGTPARTDDIYVVNR